MSGNIKAIETVYNEFRFRSRLEAKWAVLNIKFSILIGYPELAKVEELGVLGIWKVPGASDSVVIEAVKKARSARFEFGETPKP